MREVIGIAFLIVEEINCSIKHNIVILKVRIAKNTQRFQSNCQICNTVGFSKSMHSYSKKEIKRLNE